ncbi:MAG: hypothetical protein JO104_07110, partial [Candidatus Eremiobacteraeota bacterium]|nr:hypothetical protein [Candidatus Eremiobacteraeota bacterium]
MVTHKWLLSGACAAIAIAFLAARPHPTPGPVMRDFEAYWAAGAAWNARADPYGVAIWNVQRGVPGVDARRDEILPFVGPPATLLVWSAFARLPYATAAAVWSCVLGTSLLVLVVVVLVGAGGSLSLSSVVGTLALALAFGPLTSGLALGQLAVPAFTGAALVVLAATRSFPGATVAATLAFAQPNAALGLISQLGRNRVTLAIALAAFLSYALGAIAAGWKWPLAYAHMLGQHAGAERFVAIQITPSSVAFGLGATASSARLVATALAILAIGAGIALAAAVRGRFARFAAFSTLAPFVASFFHEHDLIVAYAAAAWCAIRTRGTTRIVALAGALLVAVDWLGLAQRPTGIAQSALLAVAAMAAFAALGERTERWTFAVMAAFAAVFVAAAISAVHHPAP